MDGNTSPDAKRARTSAGGGKNTPRESSDLSSPAALPDGGGHAASRSMTARSHGAAPEGELDPIFDDPVVGDEIEGLMGEPPSVSDDKELELVRQHAVEDPQSIRAYITKRARELAIEEGCPHSQPLVTWEDDQSSASTCGQYQANLIGNVNMQAGSNLRDTSLMPLLRGSRRKKKKKNTSRKKGRRKLPAQETPAVCRVRSSRMW